MDDFHGFSAMMKRLDITRRPVTHLIEAISDGDIQKCQHLVAEMDKRQVNKLKRPKHPHYSSCVVTPLLWAVMNHRHDIAEILLSKGAAVDRLGFYEAERIVNKLSPLLRDIDHHDERMIELLLRYGAYIYMAVPGPRLLEEEGGSVRYHRYIYPVDYCFGKNINVYKRLLSHADMSKEFGIAQHSFFCSTVNNYLKGDTEMILFNNKNFIYVFLALQYGGKICRGRQREGNCAQLGYCSILYDLVQSLSNFVKKGLMNVCLINCLYLVCCSDYMHRQSPMYAFPKLLAYQISTNDTLKLQCSLWIEKLSLDRLNWMLQMANTPSTLQVISRAAIRNCLKSCTPSDCSKLPLPGNLIKFVSYETTEDGIPYLLSFGSYKK